MNAMPINVAQQLVADRRASYEGIATQRRLRRFLRRPVYEAASESRVASRSVVTLVEPGPISIDAASTESTAGTAGRSPARSVA